MTGLIPLPDTRLVDVGSTVSVITPLSIVTLYGVCLEWKPARVSRGPSIHILLPRLADLLMSVINVSIVGSSRLWFFKYRRVCNDLALLMFELKE